MAATRVTANARGWLWVVLVWLVALCALVAYDIERAAEALAAVLERVRSA